VSVRVLGTWVSCAKMAEPIEMPFGAKADSFGSKDPCILDGVEIPYGKGQSLRIVRPFRSIGNLCCDVRS